MAKKTPAKKKAPKKDKPKQQFVPGMAPPSFKEIDDLAEDYVAARDNRMARLKEEIALSDQLLDAMNKHGLTSYEFDSRVVTVAVGEKVKVKRKSEESVELD